MERSVFPELLRQVVELLRVPVQRQPTPLVEEVTPGLLPLPKDVPHPWVKSTDRRCHGTTGRSQSVWAPE